MDVEIERTFTHFSEYEKGWMIVYGLQCCMRAELLSDKSSEIFVSVKCPVLCYLLVFAVSQT